MKQLHLSTLIKYEQEHCLSRNLAGLHFDEEFRVEFANKILTSGVHIARKWDLHMLF